MVTTIGFVGLGKLGLPIAVALAQRGYRVIGYDVRPERMTLDALSPLEVAQDGDRPLRGTLDPPPDLTFGGLDTVVAEASCVFIAVETPHGPRFEGVTPLPFARSDFGYAALERALADVAARAPVGCEIGVMSTVMPGTVRSRLLPLAPRHTLVYCPQFVGMGSVAHDLVHPEFSLLGQGDARSTAVHDVLAGLAGGAPAFAVSYETAELAKVIYNTFVSAKVTIGNLVLMISHEVGASASDVFDILRSADRRLLSTAYLGPGMGDGGPCHPRDNVALSWFARELGLGFDLFTAVMEAREGYLEWLCDRLLEAAAGRPLVLLGTAFKPGTDIETGSSAVLMATLLRLRGVDVQLVRQPDELAALPADRPSCFFLGCPEPEFVKAELPAGSVVVDPWQRVQARDEIAVVTIGEPR